MDARRDTKLPFFHERAIVEPGAVVGWGTRVWANVHVMSGALIGRDCNLGDGVFVEGDVVVGDRVTIKNGVQLWKGVVLEDDVFVGPNATFCNDAFPRSKQTPAEFAKTRIECGASLGANCTILPGVTVGQGAMVGAGAVVTHNVSPKTVVVGNPARHLRFLELGPHSSIEKSEWNIECRVRGARFVAVPRHSDRRGDLCFAESETHIPWVPKRFFVIHNVPPKELRGYHAHRTCKQFFVCLSGCVTVLLDDGETRQTVTLDDPTKGLLLEAMIWSSQNYLDSRSVLLVLASEKHSKEGYIHDYTEFLQAKTKTQALRRVPFLNLNAATALVREDLQRAFDRILDSGQFVLGPEVEQFERDWAASCDAKFCVGVGSGLAALHLMLTAARIGTGDEVIVPANTYIATLLGVSMAGATPVLVEPHARTRVFDAETVARCITPKTRAILSCDLYGNPVPYEALAAIAKKACIWFFSDAAQSHGASRNGKAVGSSICDGTAFSFYPTKNVGALGEAGCITTENAELADRIRTLRNYGSKVRYHFLEKGVNERMDVLQAAFVRSKIPHLTRLNARRAEIAARYMVELSDLPWLTLPGVDADARPSWHLFVIQCDERDALQSHLNVEGVDTLIHYPIPPHLSAAYEDLRFSTGAFPLTERLAKTCLSIPICPFMSDEDVSRVVLAMKSFKK